MPDTVGSADPDLVFSFDWTTEAEPLDEDLDEDQPPAIPCEWCGTEIRSDDPVGYADERCRYCRDNTCSGCDRYYDDCDCCPGGCGGVDADHYCTDCDGYHCYGDTCSEGVILGYGDVPSEVIFRSENGTSVFEGRRHDYPSAPDAEPYLGLEIECEALGRGADPSILAEIWRDSLQGWSSYDGSLSNGVECKTHPSTYGWLRQSNLVATLSSLGANGGRAWMQSSCGLHIHVSRRCFASKGHQWRFAFVQVTSLREQLLRLSGRRSSYAVWPEKPGRRMERGVQYPTRVIAGKEAKASRGVAVNVNDGTIELRYWKGTLNGSAVLGAAAVTDSLVRWTKDMSFATIRRGPTWTDYVEWCQANLDDVQNGHIRSLCHRRGQDFDTPAPMAPEEEV